jgi:hypothetical protein
VARFEYGFPCQVRSGQLSAGHSRKHGRAHEWSRELPTARIELSIEDARTAPKTLFIPAKSKGANVVGRWEVVGPPGILRDVVS